MIRSNLFQLLPVLGLAVACGGSDPGPNQETSKAGENVCSKEATHGHTGMMEYSPGISKAGPQGVTVTLVDATPAPPSLGDNTWTFKAEIDGTALSGADVTIFPLMVDHGHSTPTEPVITDNGDGTYMVNPVNFSMPGYWDTKVTVKTATASDKVSFGFCVE